MFALHPTLQGIWFFFVLDIWNKLKGTEKFGCELITLPDGGTAGIAWALDEKSNQDGIPMADDRRPILLVLPALNGESNNISSLAFKRYAI